MKIFCFSCETSSFNLNFVVGIQAHAYVRNRNMLMLFTAIDEC